jgi:hypothetical protein
MGQASAELLRRLARGRRGSGPTREPRGPRPRLARRRKRGWSAFPGDKNGRERGDGHVFDLPYWGFAWRGPEGFRDGAAPSPGHAAWPCLASPVTLAAPGTFSPCSGRKATKPTLARPARRLHAIRVRSARSVPSAAASAPDPSVSDVLSFAQALGRPTRGCGPMPVRCRFHVDGAPSSSWLDGERPAGREYVEASSS